MNEPVTNDDIVAARARIGGAVRSTPLEGSATLGRRIGAALLLKCENLQRTGSFKVRGALNLARQLDSAQAARGLVTVSAGNHAQALAWAAAKIGAPATVVMPENASPPKIEASKGYGAEVVLHGDGAAAFQEAHRLEAERGLVFVHPFDDPRIVAGQATVGLEILAQASDVTVVVVPIGGGGLISGVALAIKSANPAVRVIGVEPVGAAVMRASLDAGSALRLDRLETIADGLAAPMAGELNYELVRRYVDDVVTVTDEQITRAMAAILSRAKLLVEPAGAAGVAALLAGAIPVSPSDRVVAVLSGGNVSLDRIPREE